MYRKTYDPRATLMSPRMHKTPRESRPDDALAQRIGERIIYWTWITGLTAITTALIIAAIRKIIR